ncbi:MAG: hypothetical protein AB7V01_22240 [Vicinamibacterales bacterium]
MNPHRRVDDSWIGVARGVTSGQAARTSFADEVAIDFPSVAESVERMQDGFIEPDASPRIHADITVSPHQAFTGTIVPMEVPVRCTCRHCGGRGEVWSEPCEACDGRGDGLERRRARLALPPALADGARFTYRIAAPRGLPTRVDVLVTIG